MGLVLACMLRILYDDWSSKLGENRSGRVLNHLAAMLREMQLVCLPINHFHWYSKRAKDYSVIDKSTVIRFVLKTCTLITKATS